jgi:hypothetical protein
LRKLLIAFLLWGAIFRAFAQSGESSAQPKFPIDQERTKWVAQVIRTILTIRPGMTRADLQKAFTENGGPLSPEDRRYVYRTCPYIKFDVDFAAADREMEKAEDRIAKISKLFLEYSIRD